MTATGRFLRGNSGVASTIPIGVASAKQSLSNAPPSLNSTPPLNCSVRPLAGHADSTRR